MSDITKLHQLADALGAADCSEPDEIGEVVDQVAEELRTLAGEMQISEAAAQRSREHGPLKAPDHWCPTCGAVHT